MAPNPHKLTLSQDAFEPGKGNGGGGDTTNEYPSEVKLVVSGSAGPKGVDSLAADWKETGGFGKDRSKKTTLSGIVYELGHGEKADPSLEAFSVSNEAPGNVPLTLIHPLVSGVSGKLPPKDSSPQHAYINFSLPTITKADEVQGENEGKWLELLKEASQRSLTLELAVSGDDSVREAVEKLLGKAWDEESERAKAEGTDVNTKGVRIIFDNLAGPPLSHPSSQLLRSDELEGWTDFIRRLALHPRVFLKLSPLPLPSLLPSGLTASLRAVDAPTSSVSSTLAAAVHSASDVTNTALNTTAGLAGSGQDARGEISRRLRIFLDAALEAFGEERIVWAAHVGSGSASLTRATAAAGKEALSEPEEWFEICRESLTAAGLKSASLDNIFANNASKVYRL